MLARGRIRDACVIRQAVVSSYLPDQLIIRIRLYIEKSGSKPFIYIYQFYKPCSYVRSIYNLTREIIANGFASIRCFE